jgi:hypothetical protein
LKKENNVAFDFILSLYFIVGSKHNGDALPKNVGNVSVNVMFRDTGDVLAI